MKKKIVWLTLSCLMALSLVVASCGPAVTEEEEEEEVITEEEEEEEVTEEEAVTEGMVLNTAGKLVEKPRYGGWYYMRISGDIRGFDDVLPASPAYMTNTLNLTHDELSTGDWALGPQGTGDASWTISMTYFPHLQTGQLATGYEIPDNETIIWHIRKGVYWHDRPPANGREYNAHDAVFNLKRAYLTEGAYLTNTYRQDRGEGPISITALDDWTVEMKVPPDRQVPLLFATEDFISHQCPEAIEEYGDADSVESNIGTGAFIMTDYIPVSSITFERNPNYWGTNPLHPEDQLPYIDGVQILVIPDSATAQAAFRVGKLETRTVEKEDWEALLSTRPELLWERGDPQGCAMIYMRQDNPELPYDDIRVRKALFYAINHQEMIDEYYEGEAEMITSPITTHAEFKGMYTPLEEYPEEVQKLYGYYPEEAKQLLAEAGYPNGFECTILASSEGLLPMILDWWKAIGVIAAIDIKTSPVLSSIMMRGQHEDMLYTAATGTNPLKCNPWRTDSYLNYSKIQNDEFDEWFEEYNASMLDWDKICRMKKELEPKMRAQAYFIDLPSGYYYYMWWPWLKGWSGETSPGYFNAYQQMAYMWIDTELREEMVGLKR